MMPADSKPIAAGVARKLSATGQAPALSQDNEDPAVRRGSRRPHVYLAAGLSFVAAQIHGWVMLDHFAEQPLEGIFFLVVAFGQAAYAAALLDRPHSVPLLTAGLVATVGLLFLLVVEHTVGLPLAGLAGHAHAHAQAGTFDYAALAAFVVASALVVVLAALLWTQAAAKRARRRLRKG